MRMATREAISDNKMSWKKENNMRFCRFIYLRKYKDTIFLPFYMD